MVHAKKECSRRKFCQRLAGIAVTGAFVGLEAAAAPKPTGKSVDQARLREVSEEFEAIFVKQLLDSMRNTVQKSGLVDGGFAEQIYEDMLYDEYAQTISKTNSFGIAEMIYNQLSAYV